MDKRTLLAIALAMAVMLGYQFLLPKQEPAPTQPPAKEATKESSPTGAQQPVQPAGAALTLTTPAPREARDVRVETSFYSAVFSTAGGTLKHFELKKYKNNTGAPVALLSKQGVLPALAIGTGIQDFVLSSQNFVLKGTDLTLGDGQKGTLIFEYAAPPVSVRRTYTFYGDRYAFEMKNEVAGIPEHWVTLGSDFGLYDTADTSAQHIGPALLQDTKRTDLAPGDLKTPKTFTNNIRWIAQEDKYFFSSIVPSGPETEAKAWLVGDTAVVGLKGTTSGTSLLVYAGPKEYDNLAAMKVGLEHIIDFGWFEIIARPFFWVLKFFYSFIGNYGWAIVLLTIIVRIPFIPLVNKGQRSMKKLQELQPKMNELKEKYKKDPQKLQQEMMELYKKYKVNPMGGCLPMLLQIPVFFALYKVLMLAIELRGAPFMLWITDLSAADTLFGHIPAWFPLIGGFAIGPLPIAMGVTMVIQQKMTPTSLDPVQNRMMMLMPIVFTFLFLNFASGLVLYWLVNNIFSIAQQFYTNRKSAAAQQ